MTLQKLHKLIGLQLEGKLQEKTFDNAWVDMPKEGRSPMICDIAEHYREKPDAPPMPDEVWVAPKTNYCHAGERPEKLFGETPVRYVRADRIFGPSEYEYRLPNGMWFGATRAIRLKP